MHENIYAFLFVIFYFLISPSPLPSPPGGEGIMFVGSSPKELLIDELMFDRKTKPSLFLPHPSVPLSTSVERGRQGERSSKCQLH